VTTSVSQSLRWSRYLLEMSLYLEQCDEMKRAASLSVSPERLTSYSSVGLSLSAGGFDRRIESGRRQAKFMRLKL
jgi:hypothetical protein